VKKLLPDIRTARALLQLAEGASIDTCLSSKLTREGYARAHGEALPGLAVKSLPPTCCESCIARWKKQTTTREAWELDYGERWLRGPGHRSLVLTKEGRRIVKALGRSLHHAR